MIKYEVTYQSVNGTFALPARTMAEAKQEVLRLKEIIKQPGHAAWGIKIVKLV